MTGVAISNQLIFVFNLCIFGAISGASIFGAQFYGKGDHQGLQYTFRFKIMLCLILTTVTIAIFSLGGTELIMLYLSGDGNAGEVASAMKYAKEYLLIMFLGLFPYALTQCYSGTLRETGQATLPMVAGVSAVAGNVCLNYILIFGKMGAPVLGVRGAAIATVISRFVELLVVASWTHMHSEQNSFIIGVFRSIYIPKHLIGQISVKGLPLLINETMFGMGIASINQYYSTRGYDVVAANNICQTFFNVFGVAFMAVGAAIAIMLGQLLGAGKLDGIYFICASFIPQFYNASEAVKVMAKGFMRVCAFTMPLDAMAHASYFTLRSGGKIIITLLFDSGFLWLVSMPVVFLLVNFTTMSVLLVYAMCQMLNLIKGVVGIVLVEKGIWIRNLVESI